MCVVLVKRCDNKPSGWQCECVCWGRGLLVKRCDYKPSPRWVAWNPGSPHLSTVGYNSDVNR